MEKKTIVFDIDGTLLDCAHRLDLILGDGKKDYAAFHRACVDDTPILPIVALLDHFYNEGYNIVLCTGRPRSSEEGTLLVLHRVTSVWKPEILMRPDGNYRPDTEVKPKLLKDAGYTPENVWFIVEDRAKVVKKWRELGFTVLQCAEGDY